jgi:hypothetical protein
MHLDSEAPSPAPLRIETTETGDSPDAAPKRSLEEFRAEHSATLFGIQGGVYVIPEYARSEGDRKEERRHLLAVVPSGVRAGTAVYGTRSSEAAIRKAPHRRIAPRYGRDRNGLMVHSFFYPTVVTYVYPGDLNDHRGSLSNAEADPLRRQIRSAFGIGEKRSGDEGVDVRSWRGRIVEVPAEIETKRGFRFGMVLTCHSHSVYCYDQLVVPLFVSDPALEDPEQDVVSDSNACQALLKTSDPVVWVVPMLFTIHQKRQPLKDTGQLVSEGDLQRVEDVLVTRFSL